MIDRPLCIQRYVSSSNFCPFRTFFFILIQFLVFRQIKTHFEYICYDLIATCDHRAESFILRSCNEASKPIYENLHKEYEKYFKFKGKV